MTADFIVEEDDSLEVAGSVAGQRVKIAGTGRGFLVVSNALTSIIIVAIFCLFLKFAWLGFKDYQEHNDSLQQLRIDSCHDTQVDATRAIREDANSFKEFSIIMAENQILLQSLARQSVENGATFKRFVELTEMQIEQNNRRGNQ